MGFVADRTIKLINCKKTTIRLGKSYVIACKNYSLVTTVTTVAICVLCGTFYLTRHIIYPSWVTNHKSYACLTFNGRLANHVFQYASVYGISMLNNLTIILAQDDDLLNYFEVPSAEIRNSRDVCGTFEEKFAPHCCVFDSSFMDLPKQRNYKLGVYLQSWKYFAHVFEEVRKELTFKKNIRENSEYIIENFRAAYTLKHETEVTVIGVHIRRGDIASQEFIQAGGVRLVPDSYIEHAVDWTLEKYRTIVYIVCSDDINHAKEVMKYKNISAEFVHTSPIQDLAVLASCDHVITTSGSFSWWAGFLSRGTVLYYKYPMVEGSFERTEYNYEDFFPQEWIGLE